MEKKEVSSFDEVLVISDDQTWVWSFLKSRVEKLHLNYVRLPSTVRIRHSWQRFKNARKIIVHWENKTRTGGAIVEEILEVAPHYDVAEQIIVVTTNPTHEDVVYFSELSIRNILKLRNRDKELQKSGAELEQHLTANLQKNPTEIEWQKIQRFLDSLPIEGVDDQLDKLERKVGALCFEGGSPSARCLDAMASIEAAKGNRDKAEGHWKSAIDKNPNYFRSYNNLINLYRNMGKYREALALMQKMQALNTANIQRLVGMGEIHSELEERDSAEHYFKSALDRDSYCSGALNGLAEIRFNQGHLDESRRLLARSSIAYRTAAKLNNKGIEMVRQGKFQEALEHYTKAQYVLPQQDKSPLLFYNIGLCYSRWGKPEMATEFLRIALVKEPNYKKAQRLLDEIKAKPNPNAAA